MARLPKLSANGILGIIVRVYAACGGDMDYFLDMMELLLQTKGFRLRAPRPLVNFNNAFNPDLDNATALHRFLFTVPQLERLVRHLQFSPTIETTSQDRVGSLEALALLCRRLAEPSRLFTVADEFGRSVEACSRIIRAIVEDIYERHKNMIYLHKGILVDNVATYAAAIREKSGLVGLATCMAFIDGTKQYISRPGAREEGAEHENLQRSVYKGNPRRHCLSWQGITVPDGLIISMYIPFEGRRHDTTMLAMSRILFEFQQDEVLRDYCMYGDPAYGCRAGLACPFPNVRPGSPEAAFYTKMSSVRESVEWFFGLIKGIWGYINYDKTRQGPLGLPSAPMTPMTPTPPQRSRKTKPKHPSRPSIPSLVALGEP
ncbi:hypothetical protein ACHHYP_17515 [Achlya hypogyna]|uniref:DDE Tnp4 domain-containing protein n=1 Tax=Achlya hypogyna TaxID=1202772 RepID=A0A1V9Y478_ACHHY|nr:hypothetical protein ACHHYP_17515 [Achlya hypogyna]